MPGCLNSAAFGDKPVTRPKLPAHAVGMHAFFEAKDLSVSEALAAYLRPDQLTQSNRSADMDHAFDMPSAFLGAAVALYLAFIALLGIGLNNPALAIPMATFAIFIAMTLAAIRKGRNARCG